MPKTVAIDQGSQPVRLPLTSRYLDNIVQGSVNMVPRDIPEIVEALEDGNGALHDQLPVGQLVEWLRRVFAHQAFLTNLITIQQTEQEIPAVIATHRLQIPDWINQHPCFHEWLLAFANVAPETIRMHPAEFHFLREQIMKKLEELGLTYLLPSRVQQPPA